MFRDHHFHDIKKYHPWGGKIYMEICSYVPLFSILFDAAAKNTSSSKPPPVPQPMEPPSESMPASTLADPEPQQAFQAEPAPPHAEGVFPSGGLFVVYFHLDGEQNQIAKSFPTKTAADSWFGSMCELRKSQRLGPALRGLTAAVAASSKDLQAFDSIKSKQDVEACGHKMSQKHHEWRFPKFYLPQIYCSKSCHTW